MAEKTGKYNTHRMILRIPKIHEAIASNTYPSKEKLCEVADIKSSTFDRDIRFMRESLYAPIEYDPYHRGYYYSEPYTPEFLNITLAPNTKADPIDKENFAKYINAPVELINALEESTNIGFENQTPLEPNIEQKYCGRSYLDGSYWIGLKVFDFTNDYQLCIAVYEEYAQKEQPATRIMQNKRLSYIAEDASIDGGYWLYHVIDKKILENVEIAKREFQRLLKFFGE